MPDPAKSSRPVFSRAGAGRTASTGQNPNAPAGLPAQEHLGNTELRADGPVARMAHGAELLRAAGFCGVPTPANVPMSAMRAVMRMSQAAEEGLDTSAASGAIQRSSGAPLPDAIRARLETAFGHDFSHVRVHTDGAAAEASVDLNALAFTLGSHVFFGPGQFSPSSSDGLELIAHELMHVVQADEHRLPSSSGDGLDVSSPQDAHEREAVATAAKIAGQLRYTPVDGARQVYLPSNPPDVEARPSGDEVVELTSSASVENTGAEATADAPSTFAGGGEVHRGAKDACADGKTERVATNKVAEIRDHLERMESDVDTLAARLTDAEMKYVSAADRILILDALASGTLVFNGDEMTILRLLAATPKAQVTDILGGLQADNARLLKLVHSALDFSENKAYHEQVRALYFQSMSPETMAERMQDAVELPWADPGLIPRLWSRVFEYHDVSFTIDGKIHISYWEDTGLFVGTPNTELTLDPFEMVAVRMYYDESHVGATKGEVVFMPAVTLLSLYCKQFKHEVGAVSDVALVALGGLGIASATTKLSRLTAWIFTIIGGADVAVRSLTPELSKTEAGNKFLKAWSIVSTLMLVFQAIELASTLPKLIRALREEWTALRANRMASLEAKAADKLEQDIKLLVEKADDLENLAKLTPPTTSPEALNKTKDALRSSENHITETDFSSMSAGGPSSNKLPKSMLDEVKEGAKPQVAGLEPMPGAGAGKQIVAIEYLDQNNKVTKTVNFGDKQIPEVPRSSDFRVNLVTQDGSKIAWNTADSPPEGFRLKLRESKLKDKGFSGGHTRDAWNETLVIYGDLIEETSTKQIMFELPGKQPVSVTKIEYAVKATPDATHLNGYVKIEDPKTIFEGVGDASIQAFQQHMSPWLAQRLEVGTKPGDIFTFGVPVVGRNGAVVNLNVVVRMGRELDPSGQQVISTWYVAPDAFENPALIVE